MNEPHKRRASVRVFHVSKKLGSPRLLIRCFQSVEAIKNAGIEMIPLYHLTVVRHFRGSRVRVIAAVASVARKSSLKF